MNARYPCEESTVELTVYVAEKNYFVRLWIDNPWFDTNKFERVINQAQVIKKELEGSPSLNQLSFNLEQIGLAFTQVEDIATVQVQCHYEDVRIGHSLYVKAFINEPVNTTVN